MGQVSLRRKPSPRKRSCWRWLRKNVTLDAGRTYAGGLVKFEPDDDARTPLRYLAAPPISDDDLKTLADTS
ncbi:hypothetical protein [Thiohalocapsa sp.]|jgi:hypothetical protein|uniref:hypothetical protein n=1 Tax=Thiohalocapsa sp. TaxID=2497641 RepID=UPI0025EE2B1A|nr:hypothetical protein [Thiohalocapsa sp.]